MPDMECRLISESTILTNIRFEKSHRAMTLKFTRKIARPSYTETYLLDMKSVIIGLLTGFAMTRRSSITTRFSAT